MLKNVVKVSRNSGGFRVIIPHLMIKVMGWDKVRHVVIEHHPGDFILIRRLFSDEEEGSESEGS